MSNGDGVAAVDSHAGTADRNPGTVEGGVVTDTASPVHASTDVSRRQFLGVLATGAATAVGASGTASAQQRLTVVMGSNYFDPVGLRVEPGTTVRFEIADGSHSATAYPDRIPEDAAAFDSGVISDGAFEHTFETPGTYDYYCTPHRSMGMVGRIVVGEPGGPAEATPIPDGTVPDSETIVEQGSVTRLDSEESGSHGEMKSGSGGMGGGSWMMNGGHGGWMMLLPIGFLTTFLGLVGGVVYWASRSGSGGGRENNSAMSTLQQRYARAEIDEDEFESRKRRLQDRDPGE